jgi:Transposase/DDE superfamily endonuclease
MKPLSPESVNSVLAGLDLGQSHHQIHLSTGASLGVISSIRSQHRPTLPRASGGRPHKLSSVNIHYAIRSVTSHKSATAAAVTRDLIHITQASLSPVTVRRQLKAAGLRAAVRLRKPLLSAHHRKERLDFALAHQHWTVEDWKQVIWSDETKVNHMGSDGKHWVWKRPGQGVSGRTINPTVKFGGGSIMIWGCILWDGPGFACRIDGTMDAELYVQILEDELLQSIGYYGKDMEDIIFQQDNDPKHTSKRAKNWFQTHNLELLSWPAQSPDLNIMENIWAILKRRLGQYEVPPNGMRELWDRVQVEWEKIGAEDCQKLIMSMPDRCKAVIKAKGGHTKY